MDRYYHAFISSHQSEIDSPINVKYEGITLIECIKLMNQFKHTVFDLVTYLLPKFASQNGMSLARVKIQEY